MHGDVTQHQEHTAEDRQTDGVVPQCKHIEAE